MARNRSKGKNEKKTWLAFVGVVVLIVLVLGTMLWLRFGVKHTVVDKETLCPVVNGRITPKAQTIVLIDLTDKLTTLQQNALSVGMDNLIDDLAPGTLLSVFVISDDAKSSETPIFAMCKPRDGSDASEITENARLMRKRFKSSFAAPLQNLMESLGEHDAASYSPIIESLQSIAVNGFERWSVKGEKNLVIYSDMIQYTPELSMYNRNYSYDSFSKSAYALEHTVYLPKVKVQLHYFINNSAVQRNQNLLFWTDFFKNAGARVTRVTTVGQ